MKKKKHTLLETNVDDITPEIVSYLVERIMDEGAYDIHVLQTLMKKGRLGYLIRVITDDPEKFSRILMEETGTLGVRVMPFERFEADRKTKELTVKLFGKKEKLRVKVSDVGKKPEYDDVRKLAKKHKKPFRDVLREIEKQI
jgi:pyridinium-3,5-bisthiocarboxylic acid mononucleotide nickel chelatase